MLIAISDGFCESEQAWKELLLDVKQRGLVNDPKVAVGDGALGFWKAVKQVFPSTREQRCCVHKTANVLDKLPKHLQPKAKEKLHAIWMPDTRKHAERAFDEFLATYEAKYAKACECLKKDRDELLTFYDFPAEHWMHLRTTNPIESTFATVRLRHRKTKGRDEKGLPGDGLQADAISSKALESPQRLRTPRGRDRRHPILRRSQTPGRRLIKPGPDPQDLTIARASIGGGVKSMLG